jgi:hypothetical protein
LKTPFCILTLLLCLLLACCGVPVQPAGPASPSLEEAPASSRAPSPPSQSKETSPPLEEKEGEAPEDPWEPLPEQGDAQDAFEEALEELMFGLEGYQEPEEVIRAYLELQYLGYAFLQPVDLGLVLDLDQELMQNLQIWQNLLIQRRRLLYETDLCYVERERFDFDLTFIDPEELTDGRLEHWNGYNFGDRGEGIEYHFVVTGQPGKAYPPLLALNAQHTVRLIPQGESWKITFHYFPGAGRKFYSHYLAQRDDDEVMEELIQELTQGDRYTNQGPKDTSIPYRGIFAARYALQFAETPNPDYYHVGDWYGNCMNFVSQCVLHGFGEGKIPDPTLRRLMTREWFSGGGGGTLAWENVDHFWDYATGGGPLRCQVLSGAEGLRAGDVIQTRSSYLRQDENPQDFTHSLIVAEPHTLTLAQNSPANLVYFSDLVGVHKRYLRPLYLD